MSDDIEDKSLSITRSEFLKLAGGFATGISLFGCVPYKSASPDNITTDGLQFQKVGEGLCKIQHEILKTKNAYAAIGDSSLTNYELEFNAQVPPSAENAQIWAGFRASGRYNRYILGLIGNGQNDVFLSRLGNIGTDEFLALREAHFPVKPVKNYPVKIQVVKDRIRIFLNNESKPHIDIIDENATLAPKGKATLGGSWTQTNFTNISVKPLADNALENVPQEEYSPPKIDKELKRKKQRAAYNPIQVNAVNDQRSQISLDGDWLFKPGYDLNKQEDAISQYNDDQDWNILKVPNFWNPNKVWLYGDPYKGAFRGVADSYDQGQIDRCESYTFDYKKTDIGWYRQWVHLPEDIENKHLELHFDAVSKLAEVWINGEKAGGHIGMFGEFKIDGTGLFKPGKNVIAVKVFKKYGADESSDDVVAVAVSMEITEEMLNSLPHDMYISDPAGIWQPVSLVISDPVKIDDVFIKPNLQGAVFDVTAKNYTDQRQTYDLATKIAPVVGSGTLYEGESQKDIALQAGESKK